MRTKILYIFMLLLFVGSDAIAQRRIRDIEVNYRRSSIYSLLIGHKEEKFSEEIKRIFLQMPVPDKYNEHELSIKTLVATSKAVTSREEAERFLSNNHVASRLVSRWYNRNHLTGECDVELIKQRGIYNASSEDKEIVKLSQAGESLLEDAGEELISNTFVLMNDICYVDKEKTAKAVSGGLRLLGAILDASLNTNISKTTNQIASMTETIKGFKTKVTTHLFQLEWNEEYASRFYSEWYSAEEDKAKVQGFNKNRGLFKLKYVGSQTNRESDVSFMGVNLDTPDAMVRKACQRALDENVALLQKNFEAFQVKIPLHGVEPLVADIGLKEGITSSSKFEVLEVLLDDKGKQTYKRVGIVSPQADKIWDNRYMAEEEGAHNANLQETTFKKISGGKFYAGMLLREIK